jgi:tetratricopeptide (TPR) repeat protein
MRDPETQMGVTATSSHLEQDWLALRHYPDLDPRAERALRAAGLSWQDEAEAERKLAEACALSPEHIAVSIAHYRYHLYKHRFQEAERYARECLRRAARDLGLPEDYREVRCEHADFALQEAGVRFWLFGLQAYGYVLLRCGRRDEGIEALQKLAELDRTDQTKTRILLDVITRPASD